MLLDKVKLIDVNAVLRWSVARQMKLEGGFQGRTNKLVDGCYSMWVGGPVPVASLPFAPQRQQQQHDQHGSESEAAVACLMRGWLFDCAALQKYVLVCCQCVKGGLRDKPGKYPDAYHTCYCLSGLSTAEHGPIDASHPPSTDANSVVATLHTTHPIFNVADECVAATVELFRNLPPDAECKASNSISTQATASFAPSSATPSAATISARQTDPDEDTTLEDLDDSPAGDDELCEENSG